MQCENILKRLKNEWVTGVENAQNFYISNFAAF